MSCKLLPEILENKRPRRIPKMAVYQVLLLFSAFLAWRLAFARSPELLVALRFNATSSVVLLLQYFDQRVYVLAMAAACLLLLHNLTQATDHRSYIHCTIMLLAIGESDVRKKFSNH
jgi:hypothetical protein